MIFDQLVFVWLETSCNFMKISLTNQIPTLPIYIVNNKEVKLFLNT